MRLNDLSGRRFGRLVVSARAGSTDYGRSPLWRCVCDCGHEVFARGQALCRGRTSSCGCLRTELLRARATHGMTGTRVHTVWQNIVQRCTDSNHPRYKDYGGRGITVCERWQSDFAAFLADMGEPPPGMTLDREDNNGHYEPGNCRWATPTEQANNRRTNRVFEGKTIKQWSRELGIKYPTLMSRMNRCGSVFLP